MAYYGLLIPIERATHHYLLTMARPRKVLSFGSAARSRYLVHLVLATEPPDQDPAFTPSPRHSTHPSPAPQLPAIQVPVFYFHLSPQSSAGVHQQQQSPTAQHNTTHKCSTSPRHMTHSSANRQHSYPRPISPHHDTSLALHGYHTH